MLPYYLGFSYFVGIGPHKFDLLLKRFSTPEKAYNASIDQLEQFIGPVTAAKFIVFRNRFDPEKEIKNLQKSGITILHREHSLYPPQLKELSDPPICLYVKGDVSHFDFENEHFFGIVGTRKPTTYGWQIAQKFSREMSEAGFVIVSGMALGIDTSAHLAALDAKGKTIAFLGCGVNIIYPLVNRILYDRIVKEGSLVISEVPPDMTAIKGLFVSRNRLISGLSKGVLIAEGLKGSGSLITARCALEQGKEVFAPPAPITSDMSEAPNSLLKDGAKLVTTVDDILEEFNMSHTVIQSELHLNPEEQEVYELLKGESYASDDLARELKKPIYIVLPILSSMELSGVIEKNMNGKYQIKV